MDVVLWLIGSACCTAVVLLGIGAALAAASRRDRQQQPDVGPHYTLTRYRTEDHRERP